MTTRRRCSSPRSSSTTTPVIKSQTVFMGDFPIMTDKGSFIINGTERVVVSQLVRSPGVYYDSSIDKATEKTLHTVKVILGRGAWLEFDIDKRDTVGVRIDRKRRQPVTVLLKALGLTADEIRERFGFSEIMMSTLDKDPTSNPPTRRCSRCTASCAGRAADQGVRRRPSWRTCSSRRSATTSPRVGRQDQPRSSA